MVYRLMSTYINDQLLNGADTETEITSPQGPHPKKLYYPTRSVDTLHSNQSKTSHSWVVLIKHDGASTLVLALHDVDRAEHFAATQLSLSSQPTHSTGPIFRLADYTRRSHPLWPRVLAITS